MSNSDSNFSAGDLPKIVGSILWGGAVLGGTGFIIGIVLDVFGVRINSSSSFFLFSNGIWVGAIVGVLLHVAGQVSDRKASQAYEARELAESELLQRLERRERHASELRRQQRVAALATSIQDVCTEAVSTFEQLPSDLSDARGWISEAQQHFHNNAYSPFWHAIENTYDTLGCYNERIAVIETLSDQYKTSIKTYTDDGGSEMLLPFPVQLNTVVATQAGQATARVSSSVVYSAQRDAVFAQIWEQRRTTAAVVRGFANLEQAVNHMSSTLAESIASLKASTDSLTPADISMGTEITSAATTTARPGGMQPDIQIEFNVRMNRAVHSLKEEERLTIDML